MELAPHFPVLKRLDGHGHGQVGLAGARRADAQGDGVLLDSVHIPLLAQGLGLDGLALGGDAEHIPGDVVDVLLVARLHQIDDVADVLLGDGLLPPSQAQQALDRLDGVKDVLRLPGDLELVVPAHHRDVQLVLNELDVFVKRAEDVDDILNALDADGLFDHGSASFSSVIGSSGTKRPISSVHSAWRVTSSRPSRCAEEKLVCTTSPSPSRARRASSSRSSSSRSAASASTGAAARG